jgi:hypothetical protein
MVQGRVSAEFPYGSNPAAGAAGGGRSSSSSNTSATAATATAGRGSPSSTISSGSSMSHGVLSSSYNTGVQVTGEGQTPRRPLGVSVNGPVAAAVAALRGSRGSLDSVYPSRINPNSSGSGGSSSRGLGGQGRASGDAVTAPNSPTPGTSGALAGPHPALGGAAGSFLARGPGRFSDPTYGAQGGSVSTRDAAAAAAAKPRGPSGNLNPSSSGGPGRGSYDSWQESQARQAAAAVAAAGGVYASAAAARGAAGARGGATAAAIAAAAAAAAAAASETLAGGGPLSDRQQQQQQQGTSSSTSSSRQRQQGESGESSSSQGQGVTMTRTRSLTRSPTTSDLAAAAAAAGVGGDSATAAAATKRGGSLDGWPSGDGSQQQQHQRWREHRSAGSGAHPALGNLSPRAPPGDTSSRQGTAAMQEQQQQHGADGGAAAGAAETDSSGSGGGGGGGGGGFNVHFHGSATQSPQRGSHHRRTGSRDGSDRTPDGKQGMLGLKLPFPPKHLYTCTVGRARSKARYSLPGSHDVGSLLEAVVRQGIHMTSPIGSRHSSPDRQGLGAGQIGAGERGQRGSLEGGERGSMESGRHSQASSGLGGREEEVFEGLSWHASFGEELPSPDSTMGGR